MVRGLKKWVARRRGRDSAVRAKGRKLATLAERLTSYAEVAAISEGGQIQFAQDLIRQELLQRPKVLMVGGPEGFSRPLMEYAVGFAKRMGYEIVALSCLPMGRERKEILAPAGTDRSQGAGGNVAVGVERLVRLAEEAGVPCRHVAMTGSLDRCIGKLLREIHRVMFVLTEADGELEMGLDPLVPVYSLSKPSHS